MKYCKSFLVLLIVITVLTTICSCAKKDAPIEKQLEARGFSPAIIPDDVIDILFRNHMEIRDYVIEATEYAKENERVVLVKCDNAEHADYLYQIALRKNNGEATMVYAGNVAYGKCTGPYVYLATNEVADWVESALNKQYK